MITVETITNSRRTDDGNEFDRGSEETGKCIAKVRPAVRLFELNLTTDRHRTAVKRMRGLPKARAFLNPTENDVLGMSNFGNVKLWECEAEK